LFLAIASSPVLAWGERECSFSKKNKESQDVTIIEQVENSESSDK
tara:strand:+ start:236 stop:370 length:135 start_codon:yes stop_codon:yes gene_type:complete